MHIRIKHLFFAVVTFILCVALFAFPMTLMADDNSTVTAGDDATGGKDIYHLLPEDMTPFDEAADADKDKELPPCPAVGPAITDMDGHVFYAFTPAASKCSSLEEGYGSMTGACFPNSYQTGDITELRHHEYGTWCCSWNKGVGGWRKFRDHLIERGAKFTNACYICGCIRGNHIIGGDGCFPPGVKISMADGSQKAIENISSGDKIWNPKTKKEVSVKQVIEGPEKFPLIRLGFADTLVTVSKDHPVLTEQGIKPASELEKNDRIYDAQGSLHSLAQLEELPVREGQRVINLVLDAPSEETDQRMMVSDGIITGDIVLQKRLIEARKEKP